MIAMLRRKFVLISMLSLSLLLFVLTVGITVIGYASMEGAADDMLVRLLDGDRKEPRKGGDRPTPVFGYRIYRDNAPALRHLRAELDENGEITEFESGFGVSMDDEEAKALVAQALSEGRASGKLNSYKYRVKETEDGSRAIAFVDITAQAEMIIGTLMSALGVSAVCLALMLIITALISKRAVKPIAESFDKQRRFISDAGHEIKTPLAIIQANADAMELHAGGSKWLDNIRSQTARMDSLMKDLLTLTKMDERSAPISAASVNLSEILCSCLEAYGALFEAKSLTVDANIAEATLAHGNADTLAQLIGILLDNAAKYASAGSAVRVSLQPAGKRAALEIANECERLPDVPPEALFDRFYRADAARTQKSGGYGLGLSIARSIAERNHGSIRAYYDGENAVRFRAELPAG